MRLNALINTFGLIRFIKSTMDRLPFTSRANTNTSNHTNFATAEYCLPNINSVPFFLSTTSIGKRLKDRSQNVEFERYKNTDINSRQIEQIDSPPDLKGSSVQIFYRQFERTILRKLIIDIQIIRSAIIQKHQTDCEQTKCPGPKF